MSSGAAAVLVKMSSKGYIASSLAEAPSIRRRFA
jgi:hypothetical protein